MDAIIAPWKLVEFAKQLSIVPPAMDGPLYHEDEAKRQRLVERGEYVNLVREAEAARGFDNSLYTILADSDV